MAKKQPMTLEQHRRLAIRIEAARLVIMHAQFQLGHAHALTSPPVTLAAKAAAAIGALKSALDGVVIAQFPDVDDPTSVYYGRSAEADDGMSALFGDGK